ncbi:MAG: hypothetical protein WCK51_01525 [Armatimonadota bacterium]
MTVSAENTSISKFRLSSGEKVVSSLAELSEYVYQFAPTGYASPKSMVSAMSEILSGKRKCSPEVARAILRYIEARLLTEYPAIRAELIDACETILAIDSKVHELSLACTDRDFVALKRAVLNSNQIVAVLPKGIFHDPRGLMILEQVATRIGLLPRSNDLQTGSLSIKLMFKDRSSCVRWWSFFWDFLETRIQGEESELIRQLIEANNSGVLVTVVAEPGLVLQRVLISDPCEPQNSLGFRFSEGEIQGMAFMTLLGKQSCDDWRDYYASRTQLEEVSFESVFQLAAIM